MPRKEKRTSFLMLTPELVDRFYEAGFLTPKGAIYCSVASRKGVGEVYRHRPQEIYKRFGFNRSTYYRKLSELKTEDWLNFTVHGFIHAWRPNAQPVRVSDYSTEAELSQPCDSESQKSDKKSQKSDKKSQKSDSESQPCDKPTPKRRTRKVLQATPLDPDLDSLDLSLDESVREKNRAIDPEFRNWLTRKAQELPRMPALLNRWLETQSKLQSNIQEFREYQALRQGASVPVAAETQFFDDESETAQRLETLQFWWDDGYQERVKATVAANPQWKIRITSTGVEVEK